MEAHEFLYLKLYSSIFFTVIFTSDFLTLVPRRKRTPFGVLLDGELIDGTYALILTWLGLYLIHYCSTCTTLSVCGTSPRFYMDSKTTSLVFISLSVQRNHTSLVSPS